MRFLHDTNVVSETTRPQPNEGVLNWLAAQDAESLFISVITLGELRRGALLLATGKKRKALLRWIETGIKAGFAGRILPVDAHVMECWAQLEATTAKTGRRLPLLDSLLAATALADDFTLVTRNVADFEPAVVPLHNPWVGNSWQPNNP